MIRIKSFFFPVLFLLLVLNLSPSGWGETNENSRIRSAVVKVRNISQRPSYSSPWKDYNFSKQRGSGVIISGQRILTSAHLVSDSKYLEIEKENSGIPYRGVVSFIGHDCDLALVDVPDKSFFEGTTSLSFSEKIPELGSVVFAYGFPTGGRRISVTRGVVSRIDTTSYSHSGRDIHLILQIDAAINSGNSGGPVLQNGKIIGIAFQVVKTSENVGHVIPITVIDHFLNDIKDGQYDGYPELGIVHSNLLNEAYRRYLKLSPDRTGVLVCDVFDNCSAAGIIQPQDIFLSIDDHPIRNDRTILVAGNSYFLEEVVERKQVGQTVEFEILRKGKKLRCRVPLIKSREKMERSNTYDKRPEYFVSGGFIFEPLSREYLKTWGDSWWNKANKRLLYYYNYYYKGKTYLDKPEVIVLIRVLPAPVNRYYSGLDNKVVKKVNGREIKSLAGLVDALEKNKEKYQILEFEGHSAPCVLDADQLRRENSQIMEKYGISQDRHLVPEQDSN